MVDTKLLQGSTAKLRLISLALAGGYALGMAGYIGDWWQRVLGHSAELPYLAMYIGALLALVALASLIPLWPRRAGRLPSYAWIGAGIVIWGSSAIALENLMDQDIGPLAMQVVLGKMGILVSAGAFFILVIRILVALVRTRTSLSVIAATVGIGIVDIGFVLDYFWDHNDFGDRTAGLGNIINTLNVPPHQILLLGWLIGLAAATIIFLIVRTEYRQA